CFRDMVDRLPMRPKYNNVRARSAKVGSGTGGWSLAGPGPACFLLDEVIIRGLLLCFFVGRTCRAGEILRLDLLDVESRRPLSHRLEHLFEWRRFTPNPTQRVDARHHERAQVWADETTFFQLLHRCRNPLLEVEHHRGPFLVVLEGSTQRFIGKDLQPPESRMVSATAEAREAFIADAKSDQGGLVEVEREPGLGTRRIFVHETTVD